MKSLRIAIFGPNFAAVEPGSPAAGAWHLLRALARHGHRVTVYQPDLFGRRVRHGYTDPEGVRCLNYPVDRYLGVFECLEEAARAQVIVKFRGAGPFDELLGGAVLEIRTPDSIAVWLDSDSQTTMNRVRRDPSDPILALIHEYDLVMLTGGGIPLVNALKHLGAAECMLLGSANDPGPHPIIPPAPSFSSVTSAQVLAVEQAFVRSLARRAAPALEVAAL